MMRGRVGLAALLCASLCAAGCASPTTSAVTHTSTPSPAVAPVLSITSLYVQRTSIYQRDIPAFETTSTRVAAMRALAATILQLVAESQFHAQSPSTTPRVPLTPALTTK
jgi:hypothetical protein